MRRVYRHESGPSTYDRRPGLRIAQNGTLVLLLVILISFVSPSLAATNPCLRFADYDSINQLFTDGGPGTKVYLCPNKLYRLSGTITFTGADQELATYGYPEGANRAIIRLEGTSPIAIQGDCRRCARVGIRNLIIDGNRDKKGRVIDGGLVASAGLVVLGGNEGQVIADCEIKDPRGFTAIHIREGDSKSCIGAVIEWNTIGPVGDEYDPIKDGSDPESSPLGRPLADGISIACKDSIIRKNVFIDNTDAAVVLYCSPGTKVTDNQIIARERSAMAGILMVDSTPFNGDYTGTEVVGNTIDAEGKAIRVGIGIGSAVWSDDTDTILRGGTVKGNALRGDYMGFGIAAAGLENWTVEDNMDEAKHSGVRSARCFDEPINPDPIPFLFTKKSIKESSFQTGFESHDFQYVVCIDGVETKKKPKPKTGTTAEKPPLADIILDKSPVTPPKDIDSAPSPDQSNFETGSEVLDGVLLVSQLRMLEAIDVLRSKLEGALFPIESASIGDDSGGEEDDLPEREVLAPPEDPGIKEAFRKVQSRVEALESQQRSLLDAASGLRTAIQRWDKQIRKGAEKEKTLLQDLQSHLLLLSPQLPNTLQTSPHHQLGAHRIHHDSTTTESLERDQAILNALAHRDGLSEEAREHIVGMSNRARFLAATNSGGGGYFGGMGSGGGMLGIILGHGGILEAGVRLGLFGVVGVIGWLGWKRLRGRSGGHTKAA